MKNELIILTGTISICLILNITGCKSHTIKEKDFNKALDQITEKHNVPELTDEQKDEVIDIINGGF